MPRYWRRRNRARADEAEPTSPSPRLRRRNPFANRPPSPPPSPSVDSTSSCSRDNPFHQRPQRQRSNQQRHQNDRKQLPSFARIPRDPPHIFLQKSLRLKQSLVRSFNLALSQIEEWYPDEKPDGELMDWQPEIEVVIPQRDDTVYSYGLPNVREEGPGGAGSGKRGFRDGVASEVRRRAVSECVLGSGVAEERWNDIPRRSLEHECMPPISCGLKAPYGII